MRQLGFIAPLALCACLGGQAGTASRSLPPPVRYEAHGTGWTLTITGETLSLRERAGRATFEYHGTLPPGQVMHDGVRYQGELIRHYVIAGLAEGDVRPYTLTIMKRACTDPRGRVWATSVSIDFQSDVRPQGCGGPLPR